LTSRKTSTDLPSSGSFREWIVAVFLKQTSGEDPSSGALDTVGYNQAFRGIQAIAANTSRRQRDEIFSRILRILTSKLLPSSATVIVDHINLLTRLVERISDPFILLRQGPEDIVATYLEGNPSYEAPLITLGRRIDQSQGVELEFTPALALKLLGEVTIR
jgi:hypothetical protein